MVYRSVNIFQQSLKYAVKFRQICIIIRPINSLKLDLFINPAWLETGTFHLFTNPTYVRNRTFDLLEIEQSICY